LLRHPFFALDRKAIHGSTLSTILQMAEISSLRSSLINRAGSYGLIE
jgi:hypothetical protein